MNILETSQTYSSRASKVSYLRTGVTLRQVVAKMASHAIFQYNVLAINDTHNTWTIVIVKMTILRLLGSSDDKGNIGVARPGGPPLRWLKRP